MVWSTIYFHTCEGTILLKGTYWETYGAIKGCLTPLIPAREYQATFCMCYNSAALEQKSAGIRLACLQSRAISYWECVEHYEVQNMMTRPQTVE